MLILSRKIDEEIWLGDDIKVKIISIDKGVVRLGIDAPSDVVILREELRAAVADENEKASISVDSSLLEELFDKLKK